MFSSLKAISSRPTSATSGVFEPRMSRIWKPSKPAWLSHRLSTPLLYPCLGASYPWRASESVSGAFHAPQNATLEPSRGSRESVALP
jgi:hypothetical protein